MPRKPKVLKGTKLNYNAGIQERYVNALTKLAKQMSAETSRQIKKLFKEQRFTQDASISSQARILLNYLSRTFSQLFEIKATELAKRMIRGTSKVTATNTRESLKELSGGVTLKTSIVSEGEQDVAKALITENVSYIKSIPQEYFTDVTGSVMRSITTGRGLADLVPDLQKYAGITERRAKNLALDQTRKAYNAISRQKLIRQNVKQFEWNHSGGSAHPRESHEKIDGMIFSLDPDEILKEQAAAGVPEKDRGFPGEPINCRCFMKPIITFGEE